MLEYIAGAVGVFLFLVVVIGGLLVGVSTLLTLGLLRRKAISTESAYRSWRFRAVIAAVLGAMALAIPAVGILQDHVLEPGGAGSLAAGIVFVAGGLIAYARLDALLKS